MWPLEVIWRSKIFVVTRGHVDVRGLCYLSDICYFFRSHCLMVWTVARAMSGFMALLLPGFCCCWRPCGCLDWVWTAMLGQAGLQWPHYFWIHASMNDLSYQPWPWWHPDLAYCQEPCLDTLKLGSVWISVFCIACKGQADVNILGHHLGPSYWLRAELLLGHVDLSFLHYQLESWWCPALGFCRDHVWVCDPVAVLVGSVAPVATENSEDGLHRLGPAPHWLQH